MTYGPLSLGTPVVLAPMAGVTNAPFRTLCRRAAAAGLPAGSPAAATDAPVGLFVSEMVTSRALVERTPESMRIISVDPAEAAVTESGHVRSVQLYGVDPATVRAAVELLVSEDRCDHIDLNFGCPVPKVTRNGGGAALPWKQDLFTAIVSGAVAAARPYDVPVTVKMRMGIDPDHLTYRDAGLRVQDAGVAAVALHGRTAAQHYSGTAHWDAIAALKEAVTEIPVLGNGDIWSAEDAMRLVEQTGCDGIVVGRGCQGRPWLFTDLVAAFHSSGERARPGLRAVTEAIRAHAVLMIEHMGQESRALREMRKHMSWYLKGYEVGGQVRRDLGLVDTLAELDERLAALDLDQGYPGEGAEGPRGRAGTPKVPVLPEGWLDSRGIDARLGAKLHQAELSISGG
nr:tRNA dihydrouridine synthase DusB [Pseudactinotalea sp. HY160]